MQLLDSASAHEEAEGELRTGQNTEALHCWSYREEYHLARNEGAGAAFASAGAAFASAFAVYLGHTAVIPPHCSYSWRGRELVQQ